MTTPADLSSLESALRDRLPNDAFGGNPAECAVAGLTPSLVVSPSTVDDVAAALALANDAGAAVIPWGAGGRMHVGMPPERYDLALDLRRLDRVVEYEPADLTVTVEAGIALDDLQRRLGEHGQWLPLDPPRGPHDTVGGLLATNASGPSRHRYGTARDLLIGIRVALPAGELVKAGGRVVKNVAGYDLGKLHIGALGTLGVIVQASFKVAPLPAASADVHLDAPLSDVMSITSRLIEARLAVESLVVSKAAGASAWDLHIRFAGSAAAVERSQRELVGLAPNKAESSDVHLGATLTLVQSGTVVLRASVLPTTVTETCLATAAIGAAVVAYPTAGIVYGAWPDAGSVSADALRDLRSHAVESGRGALILERGPVELKRTLGVWGNPRADFALMRHLKDEFDPKRILNPGRYVGGL